MGKSEDHWLVQYVIENAGSAHELGGIVFELLKNLPDNEKARCLSDEIRKSLSKIFNDRYETYLSKYGKTKEKLKERFVQDLHDILFRLQREYDDALYLVAELHVDFLSQSLGIKIPEKTLKLYEQVQKKYGLN